MMAMRLTRVAERAGLGDVGDAGVEVALLAGHALVDRVGDDVREAPPVVGLAGEGETGRLLADDDVPQPEIDLDVAAGLRDLADDDAGRADAGASRESAAARLGSISCWMKALGGIERNRPEFCRSLRITPAISRTDRSPLKSTMAIGTGSKLGLVMSMVSCARGGRRSAGGQRNAAQNRRRRGSIMSNLVFMSAWPL